MDTTAPWLQEMALVKPPPMEDQLVTSTTTTINNNSNMMSSNTKAQQVMERKATRPQKDQTLACPRCNSTNTKFCYYNNYSLTQPRYFCKSCRRYWTEGGSLRNVPVGGGSRKNKRSSSASASASMPVTPPNPNPNPNKFVEGGQDLNLAFAHQTLPEFRDFNPNHSSSSSSNMMLLPTGGVNPNHNPNPNPNRFGPFTTMMPAAYSSSGFSLQQDFRPPALNFPLDGINGGYENGGRLLFDHQSRVQGGDHPPVFWNGMIGGQGGSW